MSNQKNEWDFQDDVTKKEFKVLYDTLKRAKLPLSTEHNAVYGLEDVVLVLLYMCKNGATANRAVADLSITFGDDKSIRIPTSQWLLGVINAIDPDKMDALCRRMLESTIKEGSGLERKTGHMLAIDKHLIPFTGGDRHNDNFVISGKPKGGTSQFETYATMQVVTEEQLPTISVVRVIEDMSKIEFVRKLLSESRKLGLKKPLLLMDREFSSVDVMRFLDECGERFLMAVSKTPGIKKAVAEFRRGKRKAVSKYEMRSSNGTVFRFNLVIKKRLKETKDGRKWKYLTYATNLERQYIKRTIKDIPEKYKKRWRIENNFKSVEQIRARTCSRNHSIRVFMFFLSMTVCNLWYTAVRNMNDMMETGRRRHVKINITADVFLALLIVLVKKIITSVNKELNYYLQCVR